LLQENDITAHCKEIIERWQKVFNTDSENGPSNGDEGVEDRLVKLLESQSLATVVQKSYTEEERRIREAILAQYSQVSLRESPVCCNN